MSFFEISKKTYHKTPHYTYNNRIAHAQSELEKSIDASKISRVAFMFTPDWQIYANMYGALGAVSAGVNKKANSILQLGYDIVDQNGYVQPEIKRKLEKNVDITRLITRSSKQYDLYGTVIYAKFVRTENNGVDKTIFYSTIPASETRDFVTYSSSFDVKSFFWSNYYNRFNVGRIEQSQDKDSFYIGVDSDVDDQIFGTPKLRALFTDLDMKLRDDKNYELFLKNAAFPGIIALVGNTAEQTTIDELDSVFRSWRDEDTRFKGGVIPNGTDINGNPMVQFTTIDQRLDNRLTLEEKNEIAGKVYDNLFIPRKLMGQQSSGMGSNEYESAMNDYKINCINPHKELIERDLNTFVFEQVKKDWGQEYFSNFKVVEDDLEREANADDFTIRFRELEVELPSERRKSYINGFEQGIFLSSEVKIKGYGYSEDDITDDDKFRKIKNNDIIYKEGELLQGSQDGIVIQQEDVAEEDTDVKSRENQLKDEFGNKLNDELNKALFEKAKIRSLKSGKLRKQARDFNKARVDGFSRVPDLLETTKAKQTVDMLKEAFRKQYKLSNVKSETGILEKSLEFEPSEEVIDEEELAVAMLFAATLGVNELEIQLGRALTSGERVKIFDKIDSYIKQRIDNLLGRARGTELNPDIRNPLYDGSLDETTKRQLQNVIDQAKEGLITDIDEKLEQLADDRAQLIAEDNLSRTFSIGMVQAAAIFSPKTKQWLITISQDPRIKHLEQVGEVVKWDDTFSDGSWWSQEEINCKCGIKVGF